MAPKICLWPLQVYIYIETHMESMKVKVVYLCGSRAMGRGGRRGTREGMRVTMIQIT